MRAEMNEALERKFFANRPPRTLVLQCARIIRKGNLTIKVTSQLIDRNQSKRRIRNIKDKSKEDERKRTC